MLVGLAECIHFVLVWHKTIGASWEGTKVCGIGTMASISFYPSKNLGAFGDGGDFVWLDGARREQAAGARVLDRRGSAQWFTGKRGAQTHSLRWWNFLGVRGGRIARACEIDRRRH